MKTKLFILLLILSAVLLTASTAPNPVPAKLVTIEGTLRYGKNTCGPPDYITNEAMDKVYLTGLGFPTRGQYSGCRISAEGNYTSLNRQTGCSTFEVQKYKLYCGGITSTGSLSNATSSLSTSSR